MCKYSIEISNTLDLAKVNASARTGTPAGACLHFKTSSRIAFLYRSGPDMRGMRWESWQIRTAPFPKSKENKRRQTHFFFFCSTFFFVSPPTKFEEKIILPLPLNELYSASWICGSQHDSRCTSMVCWAVLVVHYEVYRTKQLDILLRSPPAFRGGKEFSILFLFELPNHLKWENVVQIHDTYQIEMFIFVESLMSARYLSAQQC